MMKDKIIVTENSKLRDNFFQEQVNKISRENRVIIRYPEEGR